ncbi:uncharacterized protein [Zea mays]|uniref:uncharacterized protein isoform X4 n=1 Tax=Zea mays TaxID=4577 RepID=UPI000C6C39A6|nr:uncharacterized protein LOC100502508 isoform X4 [Zea mays]|eukprot:XP_023157698.1 uncharacterized protein LOC100502508 isoform X4 [Zea mays]
MLPSPDPSVEGGGRILSPRGRAPPPPTHTHTLCRRRAPPGQQARQQLTTTESITIIIDDDSETNLETAGDALDEHVNLLLSLGIERSHEPTSATNTFPGISMVDTPKVNTFKWIQVPPEPVKEVPKEPKLSCPICMNEITEAASTVCGHIFCQPCIKAAIKAQKKCPTCRRKLTPRQQHRVYLPSP